MNRKGFTLIEMLAVVILLAVLMGIAVPAYQKYIVSSRNSSYKTAEQSMVKAGTAAMLDCVNSMGSDMCLDKRMPQNEGDSTTITLKELIDNGYMNKIKDPKRRSEFCDAEKSYAYVKKNKLADGGGYTYYACLICDGYKSKDCIE